VHKLYTVIAIVMLSMGLIGPQCNGTPMFIFHQPGEVGSPSCFDQHKNSYIQYRWESDTSNALTLITAVPFHGCRHYVGKPKSDTLQARCVIIDENTGQIINASTWINAEVVTSAEAFFEAAGDDCPRNRLPKRLDVVNLSP